LHLPAKPLISKSRRRSAPSSPISVGIEPARNTQKPRAQVFSRQPLSVAVKRTRDVVQQLSRIPVNWFSCSESSRSVISCPISVGMRPVHSNIAAPCPNHRIATHRASHRLSRQELPNRPDSSSDSISNTFSEVSCPMSVGIGPDGRNNIKPP